MTGKILVTGGAGYIGSHTLVSLLESGFTPIILDNLTNSSPLAIQRVEGICGENITFSQGDVLDSGVLESIFSQHDIEAVIHFAGLKAVGESSANPALYYQNNVEGTLSLLRAMEKANCKNIVFSSSATVYGEPEFLPYTEDHPTGNTSSPYGTSKYIVERILSDLATSDNAWNIAVLRYFNPVGAHSSGLIGEDPNDTPNNLMPFITQVAVGKREKVSVFGGDYETRDGTGVRDYLHVCDLAEGHVQALKKFVHNPGFFIANLGTGEGVSVLEMIQTFERATGQSVAYQIVDRRAGDIAEFYADSSKANEFLGWNASRSLEDMMRDSWNWQKNNPNGYDT